ncbi:hypothetical protein CTAYLR_000833 [Chrysophaeum taylorii]|uniref:protein acetyllysine N-acetyltransferase n=1 Tax=Chrysophaeum taylorii TaxID=2483200 RepID=A0AAD7URM9_9STRA|nr:hypothetical protein CTAYLR_000833 [Chrysophaeum taylorii]
MSGDSSSSTNTCLGYASRLSAYPHKGVTGLPEREDTARVLKPKLARLAELVRSARGVVALTGAGISTAAGIPDFRGPKGIWTLEDEGKKRKRRESKNGTSRRRRRDDDEDVSGASFESAAPTTTHMALAALAEAGKLTLCATQNVDGLHFASGLPRAKLAILHGCVFTEKCEACGSEYVRDHDVGGISFKPTGRACDEPCGGVLRDTVLDWEDDLPEEEWDRTEAAFRDADLALCLGTSLRITPAADLPLSAKRFVIVNLQETPHDRQAALVIRAKVDAVMSFLLAELNLALPPAPAR